MELKAYDKIETIYPKKKKSKLKKIMLGGVPFLHSFCEALAIPLEPDLYMTSQAVSYFGTRISIKNLIIAEIISIVMIIIAFFNKTIRKNNICKTTNSSWSEVLIFNGVFLLMWSLFIHIFLKIVDPYFIPPIISVIFMLAAIGALIGIIIIAVTFIINVIKHKNGKNVDDKYAKKKLLLFRMFVVNTILIIQSRVLQIESWPRNGTSYVEELFDRTAWKTGMLFVITFGAILVTCICWLLSKRVKKQEDRI